MTNGNDFVSPQIEMSATALDRAVDQHFGLTKREYFVAAAVQGVIAANEKGVGETAKELGISYPEAVAKIAVGVADALITELNK